MQSVAVLVGPSAAAFEIGIAAQVFGLDRTDSGLPKYDFVLCSSSSAPIRSTSGFDLQTTCGIDALDDADIVVVPGWPNLNAPLDDDVSDALRRADDRRAHIISICTGSFALASAGIVDGRRATTHWQFSELFTDCYPGVQFDPTPLYIQDGHVITSAGAAAGIDACLHLVRIIHGIDTANRLAQQMIASPHRLGGQAQFIPTVIPDRSHSLGVLFEWIEQHLHRPVAVAEMAEVANSSTRTLARRFRSVTGTTPHQWLTQRRVARAATLLERTADNIDVVAALSGFASTDTLRHHFAKHLSTTPTAYRRSFSGVKPSTDAPSPARASQNARNVTP